MSHHFNFLYVKAVGNGSLFVGPNFRSLEEADERQEIITMAHKALEEAYIDVSRILKDEFYGEPSFYINNKLKKALEILQEIDENF